jgi:iron(III) transport system substrate-binding protein
MHAACCTGRTGVFVALVVLAGLLLLVAPPAAVSAEDKVMAALYEAAKKDGQLTVYSPAELVLRGLEKELPKTFAGIEVKSATVEPTELATKLITEKRSGGVRADLIMGSLRDVVDVLDRGIISEQDYASMGIPQELILFNSKLIGIWNVVFAHAYNTNLIKDPAELPKTWNDFLDPKWKGKLVAWDFTFSAGLAWWGLEVGEEAVIDYARKLIKTQDVLLTRAVADVVNTGERAIAFNGGLAAVFQAQAKGLPVDFFLVEVQGAPQYVAAIPAGAKHPNAARLVLKYLLSEPGKAMVWEYQKSADAHPGANTPYSKAIAAKGGRYIFETQDNYRQRAQLADKIRKAVVGQ